MRHNLVLPDLGLGELPVTVSLWLVEVGAEVAEGDRLVELAAESVTVDLPAPTSGVLVETLAVEDEEVQVGQVLGVIEADE
ncbi:MAG: biotin attachment protein [Planctomycetia bacterium]|nr:biotin attachment protein [Planctomycetia bacterium]